MVFDARSGRILEAHHGPAIEGQPKPHPAAVGGEHRDVIAVPTDELEPGTRYRVDPATRCLVPSDDEHGVGFGSGPTGSGGFPPGAASPPPERPTT